MALDLPRFTTVICNYNYGAFVAEAVRSVLNQDYPAELRDVIVVDDGSTDDSRAVLAQFAGRADVRIIEQANAGQAAAVARGVEDARGDYVCLLDSDDLYRPGKFARVARHLASIEWAGEDRLLFHDYAIVDTQRRLEIVPSWFGSRDHSGPRADIANPTDPIFVPIPCGQVYSRALLQRLAAGLPSPDHRGGADMALGYGAYLSIGHIEYLHEVLATYRVHGGNEFAGVRDDRWLPNFTTWHRWPKYLWYLESLMGTLDCDPQQRIHRLAFIKRLERDKQGVAAHRGFVAPRLDALVDAGGEPDGRVRATVSAVTAQTRIDLDTVVVGRGDPVAPAARAIDVDPALPRLGHMALAYRAGASPFVAFLRAGDRPDATFGERLVHLLQYDAPAIAASCDYRIIDNDGVVLHASTQLRSGVWENRHVTTAPFTSYMRSPGAPLLGATVIRRTRFLEYFFAPADRAAPALPDAIADWVLTLYIQLLGPIRRLPQVLYSRRLHDAIEFLPAGALANFPSAGARDAAARYLLAVYCNAREEFGRHYSEEWQAQFIAWLLHEQTPETVAALRAIALAHDAADSADLIDAVVEIMRTQDSG